MARARSDAMKRNIDEKAQNTVVWNGELESKTTVCPVCGKPAGSGKILQQLRRFHGAQALSELRRADGAGRKILQ